MLVLPWFDEYAIVRLPLPPILAIVAASDQIVPARSSGSSVQHHAQTYFQDEALVSQTTSHMEF